MSMTSPPEDDLPPPGTAFIDGPSGYVVALPPTAHLERVDLDDEWTIPGRFTFRATSPKGESVRCAVETRNGRTRIVAVEVVEKEGAGVTGLVLDGVPILDLLTVATRFTLAKRMPEEFDWALYNESEIAALGAEWERTAKKATRKRVTSHRLEEVADVYLAGGIRGVMAMGYTERWARQLKRKCVEAGLLPPPEANSEQGDA